jgi:hypothetical protein
MEGMLMSRPCQGSAQAVSAGSHAFAKAHYACYATNAYLYRPAGLLGIHTGGTGAAAPAAGCWQPHMGLALLTVQQLPWERRRPVHAYKYHTELSP